MKSRRIMIWSLVVALVLAAVGTILYFVLRDNSDDEEEDDEYVVDYIDAENYFKENGKNVETIDVQESETMLSEAEAIQLLHGLGFDQYTILTEYSADGDVFASREIKEESQEKHPMYQTYYLSDDEDLWAITITNKQVTAYPVSYLMRNNPEIQMIVSTSKAITSYDNVTRRFFVSEPNESVLIVFVVEKIDAATLEKLSDSVLSGEGGKE